MPHTLAQKLALDLVRINTVNPPGNEAEAVRVVVPVLKESGFSIEEHPYGPGRTSLVARFGRTDCRPVMLSGHLDTVPLGSASWSCPPFSGNIVDGRLYGRGASDMKGGVAALVASAVHFASRNPDAPISVVLSANEEIGCDGVKKLLEANCLEQPKCILVAEPTANQPCLGHKGVLWLKVVFHGRTAHAAFPALGENALVKAAHAVVDLNKSVPRAESHPVMGELTMVTSRFLSGDNYNSVPDRAEVGIDIRSTITKNNEAICEDVGRVLAPYNAEIEVVFDLPPLWTDPETDTIREIFNSCDTICGQKHLPQVITFYTDGGLLGPGLNAPVVILGPGDPDMAHTVDESINLSDLGQGVDIYLEILSQLC